jgi:hypothetical protein
VSCVTAMCRAKQRSTQRSAESALPVAVSNVLRPEDPCAATGVYKHPKNSCFFLGLSHFQCLYIYSINSEKTVIFSIFISFFLCNYK